MLRADLGIRWLRSQGPNGRRKRIRGLPGRGGVHVAGGVWCGSFSPSESKYMKEKYESEDPLATWDLQGTLPRHCPHCLWHGR